MARAAPACYIVAARAMVACLSGRLSSNVRPHTSSMSRLLLRKPQPTDLDSVIRIHCDPRTNHFNPAGPATPQKASQMLDSWISHWDENGFGYWALSESERPDEVIGFGGTMRKAVAHLHGLNIYFRLAPESWGNGYATELAGAALKFAFDTLGATEVLGLVRPANMPSRRTLERVGFVQFATVFDVPGDNPSLLYRVTSSAA